MRGKSLTCRHENYEETQVFDPSIDKIWVTDPEEKIDSNGKSADWPRIRAAEPQTDRPDYP